ncbi:MAG: DUF5063 domain-containing protein, partial [Bacteroidia bacterium]|nr:DUF5063 domain-containing protein [Bacteroidia bacterium]
AISNVVRLSFRWKRNLSRKPISFKRCSKLFNKLMPDNNINNQVYSPPVIDFVTVCVEFCAILEGENAVSREEWISKMLKILPLMYIKASLLPETVEMNDEAAETFVKEEDYARVSASVSSIMGEEDVYLDVFVEDMKYSDRPVSAFVSENIADIYQDVRNFVSVYQYGMTEQMNDALLACRQNFQTYWGQKLVNVLRPLHSIFYNKEDNDPLLETDLNEEDLWD